MPKKEKNYDLLNERVDETRQLCKENKRERYDEHGERLWAGKSKDLKRMDRNLEKSKKWKEGLWKLMEKQSKDTGMEVGEFYIHFLISRQDDYRGNRPSMYKILDRVEKDNE